MQTRASNKTYSGCGGWGIRCMEGKTSFGSSVRYNQVHSNLQTKSKRKRRHAAAGKPRSTLISRQSDSARPAERRRRRCPGPWPHRPHRMRPPAAAAAPWCAAAMCGIRCTSCGAPRRWCRRPANAAPRTGRCSPGWWAGTWRECCAACRRHGRRDWMGWVYGDMVS